MELLPDRPSGALLPTALQLVVLTRAIEAHLLWSDHCWPVQCCALTVMALCGDADAQRTGLDAMH
jgi:hypothetical protein